MLRLLSFIASSSRGFVVVLAVLAGVLSGLSKAAIIAILNTLLHAANFASVRGWFLPFMALCLITPLAQFISQSLLAHLGRQSVLNMRTRLSRHILATPLRRLEEMSGLRVMAIMSLKEDLSVYW